MNLEEAQPGEELHEGHENPMHVTRHSPIVGWNTCHADPTDDFCSTGGTWRMKRYRQEQVRGRIWAKSWQNTKVAERRETWNEHGKALDLLSKPNGQPRLQRKFLRPRKLKVPIYHETETVQGQKSATPRG